MASLSFVIFNLLCLMKTLTVIPARYASTRFPGKPLADIKGTTMIERVYRQVQKSKKTDAIIVATDHEKIKEHVESFGGKALITKESHLSGTDRCLEVWGKLGHDFDLLVNVQGDEPFLAPEAIDDLISFMEETEFPIGSMARKNNSVQDYDNPNVVKAVINNQRQALYFSRAKVPFHRDIEFSYFLQHIGIYAFKKDIILEINNLKDSHLEKCESLEQLRWLDNGIKMGLQLTEYISHGVDTPEDINKL